MFSRACSLLHGYHSTVCSRVFSPVLGVEARRSISHMVWSRWEWSTFTRREATEYPSAGAVHQEVHTGCHLSQGLTQCTVVGIAPSPTLTMGTQAVSPSVPRALCSKSTDSLVPAKSLQLCLTLCDPQTENEAVMGSPALPFACMLTVRPLWQTQSAPQVAWTSLKPLQAVCIQPTPVLFPSLSAEAHVLGPTPLCTSRHASQVGEYREVARTLCAALCLLCLLHSPLKLPFCPSWSLSWWRTFPDRPDLWSFTTPSQGHRSHPHSIFSPSSYLVMWWYFLKFWLYEIFCELSVGILREFVYM